MDVSLQATVSPEERYWEYDDGEELSAVVTWVGPDEV